ncbi:MAG: hypothetical protein HOV80_13205 [Polyangiaceae bacterium]|nr:hypothetical protein [Polyangiaceae bacterium]
MTDSRNLSANPTAALIAGAALTRAEVLGVEGESVLVRLHHARTEEVLRADLAVVGYVPQASDRVLVSGGQDGLFVVGVLGEARMRKPSPEPEDTVVISARQKISIEAPLIEIDASRVVERCDETYRYAREAAHLTAKTARTVVEGAHEVVAGRASIVSEDDTVIDGARVLLG